MDMSETRNAPVCHVGGGPIYTLVAAGRGRSWLAVHPEEKHLPERCMLP